MGIEYLCSNRPVLRVMVVAALTLYLCALNLNASRYWSDDLALYTHSYEQAPDSHIVQVDLGYALVKAQRFLEARPLLASALAANAQDYNTYVGLGECYAAVDDLDEAAGYFKDAILFHPRSSSAYVHLAGVEARQNQLTEAEAHMRQGLEFRETLTADTRTYHYLLGTILEQEMKFKDALAEYEADLEEEPASALASERAELLRHALQR
jgi:tetratricopeptide (TPR) repeat protein